MYWLWADPSRALPVAVAILPEKLARALNVDVKVIRQRRHLLAGISPDVAQMLALQPTSAESATPDVLSAREFEVLKLLVEG